MAKRVKKGVKKGQTRKRVELSPERRGEYRERRAVQNLTIKELVRVSGLSESTVKTLLRKSETTVSVDPKSVAKIEIELGLRTPPTSAPPFVRLVDDVRVADDAIIPLVREWRSLPPENVTDGYRSLLRAKLQDRSIDTEGLLRGLDDPLWYLSLSTSIPASDLRIRVAEGMTKVTFAHGDRRIPIDAPSLLWDCHCKTPNHDASRFRCPIHHHEHGAEVASRFKTGHVELHYGELCICLRQGRELWPPSADAFAMIEGLTNAGVLDQAYESVLDLGCGTGVLGIATAKRNPHIQHLCFADWLVTPLVYSLVNWARNREYREYVEVRANLGLFDNWINAKPKRFDLVLCNPPYLPALPGCESIGIESTVAGTGLLSFAIENCRRLADTVAVSFSDIAMPEARLAAHSAGVRLEPISSREVPFRVMPAFRHPDYLKTLIADKDRGLSVRQDERHPYWHTVRTYVIRTTRSIKA